MVDVAVVSLKVPALVSSIQWLKVVTVIVEGGEYSVLAASVAAGSVEVPTLAVLVSGEGAVAVIVEVWGEAVVLANMVVCSVEVPKVGVGIVKKMSAIYWRAEGRQ